MTKTLQLKISLEGIQPEIWRRFVVKDSISFQYFHKIIQKVMGWDNEHMFQFVIGNDTITCPEDGHNLAEASFKTLFQSPEFIKMLEDREKAGKHEGSLDINEINKIMEKQKKSKLKEKYNLKTKISQLLNTEGQTCTYIYDFGDNWKHTLTVEKIEEEDQNMKYPFCLAGERACPPEDCRSIEGYYNLMKIREDKNHPHYQEMVVKWLGEDYDPEFFKVELTDQAIREKENAGGWFRFTPLSKLLKEDTPKSKEIKTIFNREWEYEDYLGEIECTIADFFLKNRKLTDKEVQLAIENIRKNYHQDLTFFQTELEREIVMQLSGVLQEKSITHHELKLVLDYVLWSLDNRSWMSDKQAFVKWLPFFFNLYNSKEKKEYENYIIKLGRRMGLSQANINQILMQEKRVEPKQMEESSLESRFFSLEEPEKLDFAIAQGLENPYLLERYSFELNEKKNYRALEKLYLKMIELSNNFPFFECMLGLNYLNMDEKGKAKIHLESALKGFEELPIEKSDEVHKQMLQMVKQKLKELQ